MGPLTGFKILDLTEYGAGPQATLVLSDLGAEVIKIEDPARGGDPTRYEGIFVDGCSTVFATLNRGKKSMALDLEDAAQKKLFCRMVEDADAVMENFRPGRAAALGVDYAHLKDVNPKIVCVSLTPYGLYGPMKDRAAEDMTVQAEAGIMSMVGDQGHRPVKVGVDIADKLGGFYGCIGLLIALYEAQETGIGKQVEVAQMDCVIAAMEAPYIRCEITKQPTSVMGNRHPTAVPFGNYTCKDGREIIVNITTDAQFEKLVTVLERPDLAQSELAKATYRCTHHDEANKVMYELCGQFDADDVAERLERENVPYSVINDVAVIAASEHIAARHMLLDAALPGGGSVRTVATPLKITDMEEKTKDTVAAIGEDTIAIASEYLSEEEAHALLDGSVVKAKEVYRQRVNA